jgi:hypothetical protein
MSTAKTGATGHTPSVKIEETTKDGEVITIVNPHKAVYERCYETEEYREHSPGEMLVKRFWDEAKPRKTQSLIDWGCGTGRASRKLSDMGLDVTMVDFVDNSRDPEVMEAEDEDFRFIQADLTQPLPDDFPKAHFGYCCDVLEHIEEEDIDQALDNILTRSKHVFFNIACFEDHFGNHPHIKGDSDDKVMLHVCIHDYLWWLKKFAEHGVVVHFSEDNNHHVNFYVTAWRGVYFDPALGNINTDEETIKNNIRECAKLGLPEIGPHEIQDAEVMILAGGPSLNDFEDEIIEKRKEGVKLVTVNGTYDWALDRDLEPSMQVIIDAREFNNRFTHQNELTENTKFLICSAADPSTFKNLPDDRTFIFHTALEESQLKLTQELFPEGYPIPGGCTVTIRAMAALRMLGFWRFSIYGFDSCLREDEHHAYKQPENDEDLNKAIWVTIAGGTKYEKRFKCAPWMVYQALDFKNAVPRLFQDCEIDVKGDGMIAHMVNTAAEINDVPENLEPSERPQPAIFGLAPVEYSPGAEAYFKYKGTNADVDIDIAS